MLRRFFLRPVGTVRFFVIGLSGDPPVFHAGVDAETLRMDIGLDIIVFELKADVAVIFAIIRIARISLF